MKKGIASIVILFITAVFATAKAYAVDELPKDNYFPDFNQDQDMTPAESPKSFTNRGIQYGGWIMPVFIDQRNDSSSLSTGMVTARLWMKSYLWSNSFIYLRGKNTFLGVMSQDGYDLDPYSNVADLDVGFIEMSTSGQGITLTLGRKFFLLGSGLVMDGRADGIQISFRSPYISGMFFGAYTGLILKDDNPYGMSDKDFSVGARRIFAGGTLSTDFYNQTFYILAMGQLDYGQEYEGMKSRYGSAYFGAGLNGVLFTRLFYYSEFVYEYGKSVQAGTTRIRDVLAFAGLFNAYYYMDLPFNPVIIFQYAFGSGDGSRDNYQSPMGNFSGNDTGFIYFGSFNGGYALRPLLANLHIFRIGFAVSPFDWSNISYIRQMTFIFKYSYYMKHKAAAAINYGFDAVYVNRDVGHGIDMSLRWKLFYDLSYFVNYGIFVPGEAYSSSESVRHYLMTGFSISF